MILMINNSPKFINAIKTRHPKHRRKIGQLLTPRESLEKTGDTWGLDNGCFSSFKRRPWEKMLDRVDDKCKFVCCPDVVCNGRRTLELFHLFDVPKKCLVLQNGIEDLDIPWRDLDAVFVGGDDEFKFSQTCRDICKAAKILDKWVHVGRINTSKRLEACMGWADSVDGSGISRFDHMIDDIFLDIDNDRQIDWTQEVSDE